MEQEWKLLIKLVVSKQAYHPYTQPAYMLLLCNWPMDISGLVPASVDKCCLSPMPCVPPVMP